MCGISGLVDPTHTLDAIALERTSVAMANSMAHRGPNESGVWTDGAVAISLSHRRLSIIDLSGAGSQPMISPSGRYVLVFNGEIYNFDLLRDKLESKGCQFRGHSDTEVLLAMIDHFGIEKAVAESVGMFAFAVWDRELRALTLVRDRLGIKPLYYGRVGSCFAFASELKAFRQHAEWCPQISVTGLTSYMRRGYVDAPHSIFLGIQQLSPGCQLTLTMEALVRPTAAVVARPGSSLEPQSYWSLRAIASGRERISATEVTVDEAASEFETVLREAVRCRLVADVPVGAFLSGGIDSTLVTALMQSESMSRIKTYTIGFAEEDYNEAGYARQAASYLGTEHTEHYVSSSDALDMVSRVAGIFDEPFADPSAIPTYFLSRLTAEHVTVALSGDGGDELFAGYGRYQVMLSAWKKLRMLPIAVRRAMSSSGLITRLSLASPRCAKLVRNLAATNAEHFYDNCFSIWPGGNAPMCDRRETRIDGPEPSSNLQDIEQMLLCDSLSYLPGDILTKVDRVSMNRSLEVRVPLLDHRVVELIWALPSKHRARPSPSKFLMRKVLRKYVPEELFDRKKMGFGIPVAQWLRGPLNTWASDVIRSRPLRELPDLSWAQIDRHWSRFQEGNDYAVGGLWAVLMLGQWLQDQSR